jgi:hypothetical protein
MRYNPLPYRKYMYTALSMVLLFGATLLEARFPFPPKEPHTQTEWYLRLIVSDETGKLVDKSNLLGQLSDSKEGYDSHDLPEMLPGYSPYLTLYFPHESWGGENTLYASDYRSAAFQRKIVWHFTVESDDPARTILLSWKLKEILSAPPNVSRG